MRKKLLIVVCALMMMFCTTLSVSAEETTTSNIKTTHYLYVKDDGAKFSTMYYNVPVKVLSLKVSDCTLHYFISNIPFQYASCEGVYDEKITLEENIANYERYFYEVYTCNEESVNSYFNIGENDYFFKTIVFHDDNSDITECNYSYLSYDLSDSVSFGESSAKDILYNFLLENSDILGDWYDVMTEDDTFGLTGFTADNTITASWTGTSHDDVIDTYNQADVGIRPGYAYKSAPGQIAVRGMVIEEYEIADKTFTKLYDELTHSDDTLFLRYLEVIPTYQKESLGDVYKGKSCWIWFNSDGSIEKVENDFADGEHGGGGRSSARDYDFELVDVYCNTMPFNADARFVCWDETTKDDLIRNYGYKNTYVEIFCEGISSDDVIQKFDCTDLMHTITGKAVIYVHRNSSLNGLDFTVAISDLSAFIIESNSSFDFDGLIYITPHYIRGNVDYIGNSTMINLYTNEVTIVEDPDDPNPEDPEEPETEEDDPELPEIGDVENITDVFPYFINLIKIIINSIGCIPKFFGVIFPFLPVEIRYVLSIGLVLALILRLIGR